MSSKPESRLQRKIQAALRHEFRGCYLFKVHGSMFQPAGIPDLLLCVEGIFIGLEVKMPDEETSEIQDENIKMINDAGGYATSVETIKEAIAFVRKAIRLSKARGQICP